MNINTLEFIHELLKSANDTTYKSFKEEENKRNECKDIVRKLRYEQDFDGVPKAEENLAYAIERYNTAYEVYQRARSALMDFESHEF